MTHLSIQLFKVRQRTKSKAIWRYNRYIGGKKNRASIFGIQKPIKVI